MEVKHMIGLFMFIFIVIPFIGIIIVEEIENMKLHCYKCGKRKFKRDIAKHEIVGGAMDYTFYKATCKKCHKETL